MFVSTLILFEAGILCDFCKIYDIEQKNPGMRIRDSGPTPGSSCPVILAVKQAHSFAQCLDQQ